MMPTWRDAVAARELMRIHIDALFTHDDRGRMVRVNEPDGGDAPRFFLGRTAEGNVWSVRHDLGQEIEERLEAACLAEGQGNQFSEEPYGITRYRELLSEQAPVTKVWTGPAYYAPGHVLRDSSAVRITEQNADLLGAHFREWVGDVGVAKPFMAMVERGQAVSICCSVRVTDAAHEAGVETIEEWRGRGHAGEVVSAWAEAVLGIGAIPLYSTSWENRPSQKVAEKLGLIRFGTDLHLT